MDCAARTCLQYFSLHPLPPWRQRHAHERSWKGLHSTFQQVSRMGERGIPDGEVLGRHLGRPSNVMIFTSSATNDVLTAFSCAYMKYYFVCSSSTASYGFNAPLSLAEDWPTLTASQKQDFHYPINRKVREQFCMKKHMCFSTKL